MKPKPNLNLHMTLKQKGYTQTAFADAIKTGRCYVSEVLCGRRILTERQQREWAKFLNKRVSDIFPD